MQIVIYRDIVQKILPLDIIFSRGETSLEGISTSVLGRVES